MREAGVSLDILTDIVGVLEKARKHGHGYMACCPAHDDRSPSLHLTPDGDRLLLHCFAGCDFEDILAALKSLGIETSWERDRRPYAEQRAKRCPQCGAPKPKGWPIALCPVCHKGQP